MGKAQQGRQNFSVELIGARALAPKPLFPGVRRIRTIRACALMGAEWVGEHHLLRLLQTRQVRAPHHRGAQKRWLIIPSPATVDKSHFLGQGISIVPARHCETTMPPGGMLSPVNWRTLHEQPFAQRVGGGCGETTSPTLPPLAHPDAVPASDPAPGASVRNTPSSVSATQGSPKPRCAGQSWRQIPP